MSVATCRQVVQAKINPDSGGHMHPQGIRTFFTRPMHVSSFVQWIEFELIYSFKY